MQIASAALLLLPLLVGCDSRPQVVVYTAWDKKFSEPILKAFEEETGIRVKAAYDLEASKTTGLVSRIMAEAARPRCDVFWSNEVIQTVRLQQEEMLEPYISDMSADIPAGFKDRAGRWTGFAARFRVLAYNTEKVNPNDAPRSMEELSDPRWKGRIGMADPRFGTTATHVAVIYSRWGEEISRAYFQRLKQNEIRIYDGNMTAARAVAEGEIDFCLTDTDDVNVLRSGGAPIDWILIDHEGRGALMLPNTVALLRGAPHQIQARQLIDYLLSPEVEEKLASLLSVQVPLHPGVPVPPVVAELAEAPRLAVDFGQAARALAPSAELMNAIFGLP